MKSLTYASVCSGIECMSVAAQGLPLKPIFFSEIEPYPCAVLKYHYPEVPNFGDMTKIAYNKETKELTNGRTTITLPDGGIDILAGGTPCQDFSLAGLRAGAGGDDGEYGNGTRSSLSSPGGEGGVLMLPHTASEPISRTQCSQTTRTRDFPASE